MDNLRFSNKLTSFWLTVNRKCNLRCSWCYAQNTGYSDNMSWENACKAINLANEYGLKTVTLIGGEPTCWPHLIDLVKLATSKGLRCGLITNGLLLSKKDYVIKLKEAGIDNINISIKANSIEKYIEATKIDALSDVLEAIKNVNALNLKNCISHVITENNIDYMLETIQVAQQNGAKKFYLSFCNACQDINSFNQENNPIFLINKFMYYYDQLNSLGTNFIFHQNLPACIWPEDFLKKMDNRKQLISVCQFHKKSGFILDTNLNVLLCNALPGTPIGQFGVDFNNAKELDCFFNSSKIINIYKKLLTAPTKKCQTCIQFENCAGGCFLQWMCYSYDELLIMPQNTKYVIK